MKKTSVIESEINPRLSSAEKKRVLKDRAEKLSHASDLGNGEKNYIEAIKFQLLYENYAIESTYVREVYPLKSFASIPCTPPFVIGVINVRGQIVSVIDIKKFFDLPEKGLTDLNKVLILHNEEMEFGILADKIVGVRHYCLADLQPVPATFNDIREEYLKGVTINRTAFLDAEKILGDNKPYFDD